MVNRCATAVVAPQVGSVMNRKPHIDVGGGDSSLVDDLLSDGYRDVTVLDLSSAELNRARTGLGSVLAVRVSLA